MSGESNNTEIRSAFRIILLSFQVVMNLAQAIVVLGASPGFDELGLSSNAPSSIEFESGDSSFDLVFVLKSTCDIVSWGGDMVTPERVALKESPFYIH